MKYKIQDFEYTDDDDPVELIVDVQAPHGYDFGQLIADMADSAGFNISIDPIGD